LDRALRRIVAAPASGSASRPYRKDRLRLADVLRERRAAEPLEAPELAELAVEGPGLGAVEGWGSLWDKPADVAEGLRRRLPRAAKSSPSSRGLDRGQDFIFARRFIGVWLCRSRNGASWIPPFSARQVSREHVAIQLGCIGRGCGLGCIHR